jgi:hypothetical protein
MIDFSKALLESFVRFIKFHNQFNETVRVTLASFIALRDRVDKPDGIDFLNKVIKSAKMPWGESPRGLEGVKLIDLVKTNQGQLSIIEVVSAFDSFTLDFVENLTQFSSHLRSAGKPFNHAHTMVICDHANPVEFSRCCQAAAIQYCDNHRLYRRIEDLTNDLGITNPEIQSLLPFFHYFRLARNCFAHYGGRANKEIVEHSQSKSLTNSINHWNTATRKEAPKLPALSFGQPIELTLVHAILASAVCFKIAKELNYNATNLLGAEGFIHMSAFYSLFSAFHEYRRPSHKHFYSPIMYFLARYRVSYTKREEVIEIAKKMGILQHIHRRAKAIY